MLHQHINKNSDASITPPEDVTSRTLENLKTRLNNVLLANHSTFSPENMEKLNTLSFTNLSRLIKPCISLSMADLLTTDTCNQAFLRVTQHIPTELPLTPKIKSLSSKLRVIHQYSFNNALIFFTNASERLANEFKGGQGEVRKGYKDKSLSIPKYSVKFYANEDGRELNKKTAAREAKYSRLLGRESFYFMNKDMPVVVTTWQEGKALDMYTYITFRRNSYQNRIAWLISIFNELNILHAHFRVHGDIKPGNIILNLAQNKMSLIDFGSTHKIATSKVGQFRHARGHSDAEPHSLDHCAYDMYAMGLIIARIFPELFIINEKKDKSTIEAISAPHKNVIETAIVSLVHALTERYPMKRCTSLSALDYCKKILSNSKHLNQESLMFILQDTINHAKNTFEDVLRDSLRPSSVNLK